MGGNISTTINEGPIECHAPDRKAYLADWASCFFFQLPYKLEDYHFGNFTTVFVILVILISVFGRIQRNYRWFILNQAIFDLCITYDYTCNKFGYTESYNCYFGFDEYLQIEAESSSGIYGKPGIEIMKYLPVFGVFLLTGSRFITIYFPRYFKKSDKIWKLILCKSFIT